MVGLHAPRWMIGSVDHPQCSKRFTKIVWSMNGTPGDTLDLPAWLMAADGPRPAFVLRPGAATTLRAGRTWMARNRAAGCRSHEPWALSGEQGTEGDPTVAPGFPSGARV